MEENVANSISDVFKFQIFSVKMIGPTAEIIRVSNSALITIQFSQKMHTFPDFENLINKFVLEVKLLSSYEDYNPIKMLRSWNATAYNGKEL